MTPKEKAESLVREYSDITLNVEADDYVNQYTAKECAIIAVDVILDSNMIHLHLHQMDYWQEVKQEIKALWKK